MIFSDGLQVTHTTAEVLKILAYKMISDGSAEDDISDLYLFPERKKNFSRLSVNDVFLTRSARTIALRIICICILGEDFDLLHIPFTTD